MVLTVAALEELRSEAFANDVPIEDAMCAWTEAEATEYFESGGLKRPASDVEADELHVSLKRLETFGSMS